MIDSKEIDLNGNKYTVTQMTARNAIKMQARLMRLLGPAASAIFVAAAKDLKTADDAIPTAITYLVQQLDEKTFENLVMDLMHGVRKNNYEMSPQSIDVEFSGDLNTLFLLLKFILEVNFGDFFSEGGIFKSLMPAVATTELPQGSIKS